MSQINNRYGRRNYRVTFGPAAFGLGWLYCYLAFSLGYGVIVAIASRTLEALAVVAGTFAMYAILPAISIGAPLGLVAGLLMRPVRNQWWHVLALGAAGFVTGCLAMVLMGGDLGTGAWPYGLGTAAASALGRFAVWRRVTVHPDPQYPAA